MRKIILTTLSLYMTMLSFGQEKIAVTEEDMTIGKITLKTAVVVVGHNPETVRKSFTKYCKDRLKIKVKSEGKNRMIAEKVNIPIVTEKTGDLLAISFQAGARAKLAVGMTLGYDLYLNSDEYPEDMLRLKEFVRKYAIYHESLYFKEILDQNNRRIDELVKSMKNNQKEINSLSKRIEKVNKTVDKENDSNKKFDLSNENISNRAKVQAMTDILGNLKIEIVKINDVVEKTKGSLQKLENQAYQTE